MIEVNCLSKHYGALAAVDDLSFRVGPGEVLGFLGPNGAGKSTTMRIIAGFVVPSAGSVAVCGHDVISAPLAARRALGYLPEGAPAWPEMTPRSFLAFIADVRGLARDSRRRRLTDTIDRLGLGTVLDQRIETLSKGYRRRVGLAQAILHDPPVLVLDEPTDGLDPNQKHEVRTLIREMATQKTILISTHLLEEVQALCSRALIVAHGRLLANDRPAALEARSRYHGAVSVTLAEPTEPTALARPRTARSRQRLCPPPAHPAAGGRRRTWAARRSVPRAHPRSAAALMNGFTALYRRELGGYLATPLAAVYVVIFLLLAGAFTFWLGGFFERGQADLAPFFDFHPWLYLFLVPAVGMRLWAEERRSGSIELLLTLPVRLGTVVIAKFLAAWSVIGVALALTFPIWITVNYLGLPDNGAILAAYLGSLAMAGAFLAIASCLSAATRSQVIAFILAVATCFLLLLAGLPLVLDAFRGWAAPALVDAVASIGILTHYQAISKGVLDGRDVAFFVLTIAAWLYATTLVLDMKKAD
jgi:ABC-type multidrug transport system ATPase subunit/ABC-type transport system involved in multi-copper enzyme maturation permease subunit